MMGDEEKQMMVRMPEFGNGPDDDAGAPVWRDEEEGCDDGNR